MIIYEGKSMIDGQPIIAIATINSSNSKTGAMVQTWIMRADIEPHHAIKTGADVSVCGDCPHKPSNNGSCYVLTFQAPLSIYRAYHRGSYADRKLDKFAGLPLRLGSYGDPLAVPIEAWKALIEITNGRTGYTHQWQSNNNEAWKGLVMASVDNEVEAKQATANGWRYFRVTNDDAPKVKGETICPASEEAGKKLQCIDCLSCSGNDGRKSLGIVINAHGSRKSNYKLIAVAA